jgi:hypothetical protein
MAKTLLIVIPGALFAAGWLALHVWMLWSWLREEPMTREEIERGDMRSLSWPEGGSFGVD